MRRYALPIIALVILLSGCKGYDWREEHRGVIASVSGYGKTLVIEFEDRTVCKVPFSMLDEASDPWGVGKDIIVQTKGADGGREMYIYWRFVSPSVIRPGGGAGLPAEKVGASR